LLRPGFQNARDFIDLGAGCRAMDLNKIPLFKAMSRRMQWLGERQKILAQNVANADTPNFHAKDLKAPSFSELVGRSTAQLRLATTNPSHLTSGNATKGFTTEADNTGEVSPSGNNVALEEQMLKVSGTATDYQITTSLYRQHMAMLKSALGPSQ
jgi:flagellar basal-body rod protein FlgB